jgi:hypothetical protein
MTKPAAWLPAICGGLLLMISASGCGEPDVERYPSRFVVKSSIQQSADRTSAYINEFTAKMDQVAEGDRKRFQHIIDELKENNNDLQKLLVKANTDDRESLLDVQDEGDKLANKADTLIAQGRAMLHD